MAFRYIFSFFLLLNVICSNQLDSFKEIESSFKLEELESKIKDSNKLSIIVTGDALLHAPVYEDAKYKLKSKKQGFGYNFLPMLDTLKPIIKKYDLAFYNQETILGGTELGLSSYPTFNSPKEFGDNMLSLGFNLISLANNHSLDKGKKGIESSLKFWHEQEKSLNIAIAGSYSSALDRKKERIFKKNGITYALLAYTYGTNGIPLPKNEEFLVNVYNEEMIKRDVLAIRDKVDFLMVSMHWGDEYQFKPNKEQKHYAALLANLGVDLVIGTHPHVLQPIEKIKNTIVIYSLGNLISAQRGEERRVGALVAMDIKKDSKKNKIKIENLKLELLWTHYEKVENKVKNFKLYRFSELDNQKVASKVLPNAKEVKKKYLKIIKNDHIHYGL